MDNTALLIIDVQKEAENICVNFDDLITNLQKLITYCRQKKVPIIYAKVYATPKYKQRFGEKFGCSRESPEYDVPEQIKPLENDIIIEKSEYSAFFGTELNNILKKLKIKTLLLAGLQAHICVQCTSADAFYNNYNVIAIKDCITSTDSEKLQQGLRWIEKFTGKIISLDEFSVL